MTTRLQITESRPSLAEALAPGSAAVSSGEFDVLLITPGWGSSGYYSAETIAAAVEAGVFAPGTHMYLDHPAAGDRPERSVRDLAGTLVEAGRLDEATGGVRARIRPYSVYAPFLTEAAGDIGLSIRGSGEYVMGEAEGRRGRIFTSLTDIASVDYVTRAGRGGRILSVLESYRPAFAAATEARVSDRRDALIGLVREAHGGDDVCLWVRDFDDTARLVWYEREAPDEFGIYQQGYTVADDDTVTSLDGEPVEVHVRTEYVPIDSGTAPVTDTTTEAQEGSHMPNIEEGRLAELTAAEEAARRVPTLEAELAEARRAVALATATEAARPVVASALEGAELPERILTALRESALRAVPLTDANTLDEQALTESVRTARTEAEENAAAVREALGFGRPRGFGSPVQGAPTLGGTGETTESTAALTESIDRRSRHIFGGRPNARTEA
jgi:hypothetical protein